MKSPGHVVINMQIVTATKFALWVGDNEISYIIIHIDAPIILFITWYLLVNV